MKQKYTISRFQYTRRYSRFWIRADTDTAVSSSNLSILRLMHKNSETLALTSTLDEELKQDLRNAFIIKMQVINYGIQKNNNNNINCHYVILYN